MKSKQEIIDYCLHRRELALLSGKENLAREFELMVKLLDSYYPEQLPDLLPIALRTLAHFSLADWRDAVGDVSSRNKADIRSTVAEKVARFCRIPMNAFDYYPAEEE